MESFFTVVCELVKFGGDAVGLENAEIWMNVAEGIWGRTEARSPGSLRGFLAEVAGLSIRKAAELAGKVVGRMLGGEPALVQEQAAAYLTLLPSQIRRSLRRPSDPRGATIPPFLKLQRASDLLALLPTRLPRFAAGDRPLPGIDLVLVELLGVGGFGEVWKARNPLLPSAAPVALKFCLDPQASKWLRHEAAVLDRVMRHGAHPGIVQLRHTCLSVDPPCLEYEFVAGGDLAGLVLEWRSASPPPSADDVARVMRRLAEIVGHAHAQSPPIVHRDLKPANILVQPAPDGSMRLRVADFGIGGIAARPAGGSTRGKSAASMEVTSLRGSHTPLYASPQQARGEAPATQDDVHALGVVWYQFLTGQLDAPAPSGMRWLKRLAEQGVPEGQIALLAACVEPEARDRPATAGEIAVRLGDLLQRSREAEMRDAQRVAEEIEVEVCGDEPLARGRHTETQQRAHAKRIRLLVDELLEAHLALRHARRLRAFRGLVLAAACCGGCFVGSVLAIILANQPVRSETQGIASLLLGLVVFGACVLFGFFSKLHRVQRGEQWVERLVGTLVSDYPREVRAWGGARILDRVETVEDLLRDLKNGRSRSVHG